MPTGQSSDEAERWWLDAWFLAALAVGLLMRILPLVLFHNGECIRDECIYRGIAIDITEGKGLTVSPKGWLPAPGYPYMLAWCKEWLGGTQPIKGLQVVLSLISIGCLYGITRRVANVHTARIAAFLFALNPTIAWFTNTLWIETIYIFLLLGSSWLLLRSRTDEADSWGWSCAAGGALGLAVLFRGIATYLPPLFLLGLLWPPASRSESLQDWLDYAKLRWRRAASFVVGLVLVVSPWSIHASGRYGGFMVSDATVGHVMFLGNNDFPPLTFDYGIGMLTQPLFARYLQTGRRPCPRNKPPVQSSACEVDQAIGWAKRHPGVFLARIPVRVAQILNPHSFLTRHVRWGYWIGFPWWAKEALVATIVLFSWALMIPGTLAAWARARGPWALIAVGTAVYTIGVTAVMYGMTRFRLPIEAIWTPYLAMFLADPRGVIEALRASPGRLAGALLSLPPLFALSLWYLPTGWPMFWR